jgi:hypothetical protein
MTDTKRITHVWVALSVITVVTWLLGHAETGFGQDATTTVALVILAIAFAKVYLIIRHFMEVRTAPVWLKVFTDVWIVVLGGSIVALYLW